MGNCGPVECKEYFSKERIFYCVNFQQPVFIHIRRIFSFDFFLFVHPFPSPPLNNRERQSPTKRPEQALTRLQRQLPHSRARQVMWSGSFLAPLGVWVGEQGGPALLLGTLQCGHLRGTKKIKAGLGKRDPGLPQKSGKLS